MIQSVRPGVVGNYNGSMWRDSPAGGGDGSQAQVTLTRQVITTLIIPTTLQLTYTSVEMIMKIY